VADLWSGRLTRLICARAHQVLIKVTALAPCRVGCGANRATRNQVSRPPGLMARVYQGLHDSRGDPVFGTLTGLSALGALFLGVLLAG
jgi:hypothetical protein